MRKRGIVGLSVTVLMASVGLALANEAPIDVLTESPSRMAAADQADNAPLQIIVSRKDQSLRVYRGAQMIAASNVSTGKRGHSTPTGIFSILEKRRQHFSNIYDSAPMPYMQRLTWSGIALHESNSVPSYPASHGCVRMPGQFARDLFAMTERGAHVVIAEREATPMPISHPFLFQPDRGDLVAALGSQSVGSLGSLGAMALGPRLEPDAEEPLGKISLLTEHPRSDGSAHRLAKRLNMLEEVAKSDKPVRIFITRQGDGNLVRDVQMLLNVLGFEAGKVDGLAGRDTYAALRRFLEAEDARGAAGADKSASSATRAVIDKAMLQRLYTAAGKGTVPAGHLFVRHNFKPLFDMPIQIRDPQTPLGVHLLTAVASARDPEHLNWLSVTLQDSFSPKPVDDANLITASVGAAPVVSDGDETGMAHRLEGKDPDGLVQTEHVLDRIILPQAVRSQINHLVGAGASITISDRGLSRETTPQGTDFIVLTRPEPTARDNAAPKVAKQVSSAPKRKAPARSASSRSEPKSSRLKQVTAQSGPVPPMPIGAGTSGLKPMETKRGGLFSIFR